MEYGVRRTKGIKKVGDSGKANWVRITDPNYIVQPGDIIKVGKRRIIKVPD